MCKCVCVCVCAACLPQNPLLSYPFDDGRWNRVLVVISQGVEKLEISQNFEGWAPEVLNHFPRAQRIRLPVWLDILHDAHRLHDKLHKCRGILYKWRGFGRGEGASRSDSDMTAAAAPHLHRLHFCDVPRGQGIES